MPARPGGGETGWVTSSQVGRPATGWGEVPAASTTGPSPGTSSEDRVRTQAPDATAAVPVVRSMSGTPPAAWTAAARLALEAGRTQINIGSDTDTGMAGSHEAGRVTGDLLRGSASGRAVR